MFYTVYGFYLILSHKHEIPPDALFYDWLLHKPSCSPSNMKVLISKKKHVFNLQNTNLAGGKKHQQEDRHFK